MKHVMLASLLVVTVLGPAQAEDTVRQISWKQWKADGKLLSGEVIEGALPGPTDVLKVENPDTTPKSINILDLSEPGVQAIHYAIQGRVRYEDVQKGGSQDPQTPQVGFLEMWNWFADGGMYFSRTLSDSGPMGHLLGTSDWRPFSLPFFSEEKVGPPTRLIVNVVLPSRGTVYLGPLEVRQYASGTLAKEPEAMTPLSKTPPDVAAPPANVPNAWWSGGGVGTVAGTFLGCLGGLIGVLASLGKARRLVLTLAWAMVGLGFLALGTGAVALICRQPYEVYYPLLLIGVILTAVMGGNLPQLKQRYAQLELRRMAALDMKTP